MIRHNITLCESCYIYCTQCMSEDTESVASPEQVLKKNVRRLLNRCHPDKIGKMNDLPKQAKTDVVQVLSAIASQKYQSEWPDDLRPGTEVAFFGMGPGDVLRRLDVSVPLPPSPKQFVDQLQTYLDTGVLLTFAREQSQTDEQKYQAEFERLISQFADSISKSDTIEQLEVKSEALREMPQEYVVEMDLKAKIDGHAAYLFSGRLTQRFSANTLARIGSQIQSFPFNKLGLRSELETRYNERAMELFVRSVQHANNKERLKSLREAVAKFPFALEEAGERDRQKILTLIDKRSNSYAKRWENEKNKS